MKRDRNRHREVSMREDVRQGLGIVAVAALTFLCVILFVLYTQCRIEHRGEYPKLYIDWVKIKDVEQLKVEKDAQTVHYENDDVI